MSLFPHLFSHCSHLHQGLGRSRLNVGVFSNQLAMFARRGVCGWCQVRYLLCRSRSNRTEHWTTDSFKIGKGVCQGCILSPCLYNLYAEYIMWNNDWMNHKLELRLLGEISITSDMQMTPPLWQKVRNKRASWWWRWKRRVKKLA